MMSPGIIKAAVPQGKAGSSRAEASKIPKFPRPYCGVQGNDSPALRNLKGPGFFIFD
jgi:hypothetical protein